MNDQSDKKTLNDLTDMLNKMVKNSKTKMERELDTGSPISGRLRKRKNSNKMLNNWLFQKGLISPPSKKKNKSLNLPSNTEQKQESTPLHAQVDNKVVSKGKDLSKWSTRTKKQKSVLPTSSNKNIAACKQQSLMYHKTAAESVNKGKVTSNKKSLSNTKSKTNKQSNLNSFLTKSNVKTFKGNDSFDIVDLPTFTKVNKKKTSKSSKLEEQKASFQKYGVILPTVDDIIEDKKDLEYCRNKIKCFNPISEDSFELPFSNEILYMPAKEKSLDCKHLTLDELTNNFNLSVSFLSDVVSEKVSNYRHQRYFDKNIKVSSMSTNDLTYNTSTVVFSYEQIDHLMSLLKQEFDPDDTKTKYFFQVLLPELCLRIFMKTYKMKLEDAVQYLGGRPLMD